VLQDGRHPVLLTSVDVAGATVEFDLVQLLTGDEARVYEQKHDHDPGFQRAESYRINENPQLRRLPVRSGVQPTVVISPDGTEWSDPRPIGLADLPPYLGPEYQGDRMFWLEVHDDTVVAMDEALPEGGCGCPP
jgi:hypothetical protein